jgi:hypothetical protein
MANVEDEKMPALPPYDFEMEEASLALSADVNPGNGLLQLPAVRGVYTSLPLDTLKVAGILNLPKRGGGFRKIVVPTRYYKYKLRAVLCRLERKAARACPQAHGFIRGRSPVTNAKMHVGKAWTVNFDLKDFFNSITATQIGDRLTEKEKALVLVDLGEGPRPYQGLPTSPAVANLAAVPLDQAIMNAIVKKKKDIIFTRYADDLSFSGNDLADRKWVLDQIPQTVRRCGFTISKKKTRVCDARAGLREVTGVMVGPDGVRTSRAIRRRLRAAEHHVRTARNDKDREKALFSVRGLREWMKLKEPKPTELPTLEQLDMIEQDADNIKALSKAWGLKIPPDVLARDLTLEDREGDFVVTRDPAYILGCSTFTTGWRSCMAHPDGQYREGVVLWLTLEGTSCAALLSNKTQTIAGVERRVMRARCWVHRFRNGSKAYDRCFGDEGSIRELRTWLEKRGYIAVSTLPSKSPVQGILDCKRFPKPYFDSLAVREVSRGKDKVWEVTTK